MVKRSMRRWRRVEVLMVYRLHDWMKEYENHCPPH
jgi:hypothetical protein